MRASVVFMRSQCSLTKGYRLLVIEVLRWQMEDGKVEYMHERLLYSEFCLSHGCIEAPKFDRGTNPAYALEHGGGLYLDMIAGYRFYIRSRRLLSYFLYR